MRVKVCDRMYEAARGEPQGDRLVHLLKDMLPYMDTRIELARDYFGTTLAMLYRDTTRLIVPHKVMHSWLANKIITGSSAAGYEFRECANCACRGFLLDANEECGECSEISNESDKCPASKFMQDGCVAVCFPERKAAVLIDPNQLDKPQTILPSYLDHLIDIRSGTLCRDRVDTELGAIEFYYASGKARL